MNTTPEERAELRKQHPRNANFECWYCNCVKPCPTLRLLDDADEADALRARAEAAEADNAALREAVEALIGYGGDTWLPPVPYGAWSESLTSLREVLAQPHPGDALCERLRQAESKAIAWNITASRMDEAHEYCKDLPGALGKNIWHAVLDDAIALRERLREKS